MKDNDSPKAEEKKVRFKSLIIDGTKYKTHFHKKYENKEAYKQKNPSILTAFIPGTVQKIFVTEGQKVSFGTRLLILEAMKMKNRILAPHAGIVKNIFVKEEQLVAKKEMLIEIE
ncbi:MAG: acetyl-CoA carboxylase biotin carboxyl carrier protein subunit [Bacteroidota bacterium]|nr:acetyl-CoA carboxylase biotin carboxyl carrier protein subunit [Bacteroidota bacterium]